MMRTAQLLRSRRAVLAGSCTLLAFAPPFRRFALAADFVQIENFNGAGISLGKVRLEKIVKSEAEWRRTMPPESFEVTRHAGTETAFTGAYWNLQKDGLFRCIGCATALFDSRSKFESGTGWPSFTRPISRNNVAEKPDGSFGMERTQVSCRRCDAHLGHVFDDGPPPTGMRYCMNSAALVFVPRVLVHA